MCVGKALTGGYLTMAAALCTPRVAEGISRGEVPVLAHGPTFMGNPLAAAVATASIDLLLGRDWRAEVRRIEAGLRRGLAPAADLPGVADVRVLGAIGVVQLDHAVDMAAATRAAVGRGVWLRPFRDLVYTMPPYITGDDDLPDLRRGRRGGGGRMSRTGLDWLPEALADLEDRDLLRVLTYCQGAPAPEVAIDGVPHLLLASNNYLGLAGDPAVVAGARAALEAYGAGAGASRLVTGSLDLHRRLEQRLAALKRCEDALVFPTGFQANVGTVPALVGRGDVVFSDELNHASLIDGCRLSSARVVRYAHADAAALDDAVRGAGDAPRRLIVTDTVFSMDGDLAPLPEIVAVAERHGCMLMVDEAHAPASSGPAGPGRWSTSAWRGASPW